jgi:3-keto-5-aminohexanoate cleavage enzyme
MSEGPEIPLLKSTFRYTDSYEFMEKIRSGMPPLIVCVACNGGVQGKEANEHIPETPEEIAESVGAAYDAGAAMVHVHAREKQDLTRCAGTTGEWREVLSSIRERCPDIIINATTGGGPDMTMDERLTSVFAGPEVASLNLAPEMTKFHLRERPASLPNPRPAMDIDQCISYTHGQIEQFAQEMKARGVKPELEVYHTGCASVVRFLIEHGLLEKPYWIQTVMGTQTGSLPTVQSVLDLLRDLPDDTMWLCSAIGAFQLPLTTLATLMGGHVRVGLEDNVYYKRGRKATGNRELVERAVRVSHELGRDIATPAQARGMLGLGQPSAYTAQTV